MKNVLVLLALVSVSIVATTSCGSKNEAQANEDSNDTYAIAKPETDQKPVIADAIAEGKALVEASDCKTCHHLTNKIIGPTHTEVAQKYEDTDENVKMLATKIIQGGSGVWGDIAMTPHPNVSQENAEKMSRYILSLNDTQE